MMATFTVDSINDDGNGSLRRAIELANNHDGYDRIEFSDELSGQQITLTSGALNITDDLAIDGLSGAKNIAISGDNNSRILVIDDGDATNQIDVVVDNLIITEGKSSAGGGAIANAENLTINNSTITNNQNTSEVPEAGGGSIRNSDLGTLTINQSLIAENQSQAFGGGITNFGQLFVNHSKIVDNQVDSGGGGGIDNRGTIAKITSSVITDNLNTVGPAGGLGNGTSETETLINSSIISDNQAFNGAGLFVNAGNVMVANSVIKKNTAKNNAGGIGIAADGNLTLNRSVIIDNEAVNEGGGIQNLGSAVANNSILTDNMAGDGGGVFNSNFFETQNTLVIGNMPNDVVINA